MVPKSVYLNRKNVPKLQYHRMHSWMDVVFNKDVLCQYVKYDLPVLRVVQETAAAAKGPVSKSNGSNNVANYAPISRRLMDALKNDILSDQLLQSQPESFIEIDERVHKLNEFITKKC